MKRGRSDGDAENGDDSVDTRRVKQRADARSRFPEYSAPASAAISIIVGSVPAYAPTFTHQQFSGEIIWGYSSPQLVLSYTDPDLRFSGTFRADGLYTESNAAGVGSTLTPDDIAECVRTSLPTSAPLHVHIGKCAMAPQAYFPATDAHEITSLTIPPGRRVAAYCDAKTGRDFVIHTWALDDPALRAYHDRMATLAMWAIETASPIDVDDPRWSVFGLYEVGHGTSFSFAGYATVYRFTNPMRRARPTSLRLAQLFVLPRYQRHGHGRHILEAVHAAATVEDAFEVTVEAPCEGMSRLRDARDVGEAARRGLLPMLWDGGDCSAASPPAAAPLRELPPPLNPEALEALRLELRCTLSQARRVVEALTLARLPVRAAAVAESSSSGSDGALFTAYRVAVKRRMYATDEDVRAVTDAAARKAVLEDMFLDAHAEYAAALGANGLIPAAEAQRIVSERAAAVAAAEAAEAAAAAAKAPSDDDSEA